MSESNEESNMVTAITPPVTMVDMLARLTALEINLKLEIEKNIILCQNIITMEKNHNNIKKKFHTMNKELYHIEKKVIKCEQYSHRENIIIYLITLNRLNQSIKSIIFFSHNV